MEVYRRPAHTFVAGFIGHPPMNLLRASPEDARAHLGTLNLPASGEVILGIRPEDLEPAPKGYLGAFPARVRVVEPLGSHQLVTLEALGTTLKATWPPEPSLHPGEEIWVRVHAERVRLFDPATGRALEEVRHG